ncbi:hypothetical protein E4T56_gene14238 [Termitomyces sp. T112]|nr:hypothetical protein E4T56_gene14238 [Termitomyces sp. T112]
MTIYRMILFSSFLDVLIGCIASAYGSAARPSSPEKRFERGTWGEGASGAAGPPAAPAVHHCSILEGLDVSFE